MNNGNGVTTLIATELVAFKPTVSEAIAESV